MVIRNWKIQCYNDATYLKYTYAFNAAPIKTPIEILWKFMN